MQVTKPQLLEHRSNFRTLRESIIQNVAQIDRSFADLENRLQRLGTDIERVS